MNKEKILIIEDDTDRIDQVIYALGDITRERVLIKDWQKAMDCFQKTNVNGDNGIMSQIYLVILDINLSKIHGMEVLRFLKKNSSFSSIPIIIFLQSADIETISEAYENGADDFITTPTSLKEFINNKELLKKYRNVSDV